MIHLHNYCVVSNVILMPIAFLFCISSQISSRIGLCFSDIASYSVQVSIFLPFLYRPKLNCIIENLGESNNLIFILPNFIDSLPSYSLARTPKSISVVVTAKLGTFFHMYLAYMYGTHPPTKTKYGRKSARSLITLIRSFSPGYVLDKILSLFF